MKKRYEIKNNLTIEAEEYTEGLEDYFMLILENGIEINSFKSKNDIYNFLDNNFKELKLVNVDTKNIIIKPYVITKNGFQYIDEGDYIITAGITNEKTVCKSSVFKKIYKEVTDEEEKNKC